MAIHTHPLTPQLNCNYTYTHLFANFISSFLITQQVQLVLPVCSTNRCGTIHKSVGNLPVATPPPKMTLLPHAAINFQ